MVWNQEMNNSHPAPYPIALASRCIESTNAQIVLDPFMGSGTTAVVSQKMNRKWLGSELSPNYCELIQK